MQFRSTGRKATAVAGAVLGLGLAAAPGALASSLFNPYPADSPAVYFYGDSGAANTLTVSGGIDSVTFTDSEPINTANPECTGSGTTTVTCTGSADASPKIGGVYVSLGDGADTFTSTAILPYTYVFGGNDNDSITGPPGSASLFGQDGDDTITGGFLRDDIDGGLGNDVLDGASGADEVDGSEGNDTVSGGGGDDEVYGGYGDDTVNGGDGGDYVEGDGGVDTVNGDAGDDTLTGDQDDPLFPGDDPAVESGNDTINGGAGEDYVFAGSQQDPGSDTINGGPGEDGIDYTEEDAGVTVSLNGVADDGAAGEADNAGADLENLYGSIFADTLTGNGASNDINGYAGADTINGLGGDDTLTGGPENDTINAGDGNDSVSGSSGQDTLNGEEGNDAFFESDGEADVLQGGNGSDTVSYFVGRSVNVSLDGAANDGLTGEGDNALVENVNTSGGNDVITGSADRNIVDSGGGDDTINVSGDGATDDVSCGTGIDQATVDAADAVATTGESTRCETVNGGAITGQPAAVLNPVPVFDKTAPTIKATVSKCKAKGTKLSTFRKRGCTVTVTSNEVFRLHVRLTASFNKATLSAAGSGLILNDRDTGFSSGVRNSQKIIVRPNRKLLTKTPKKFKVRFLIEAFDKGGNRKATTKTVTVKR